MARVWFVGLVVCSVACASTGAVGTVAQAPAPVAAAVDSAAPLEGRSLQIPGLFVLAPTGFEEMFAPSFLQALPPERIGTVFVDYFRRLGPCTGVTPEPGSQGFSGKFLLDFGGRFQVPLQLAVAAEPPHAIVGLWLGNPIPMEDGWQAILDGFGTLPGTASLHVKRVGDTQTSLAASHTDTPLAIGSAFKLYVLAELVRSVKAGERHWEDVVRLDEIVRSLPSGFLHTWPVGAPLTLHTLASLMISQSDNTATDQLVAILGREKIEAILPVAGHQRPELNRPFLTTLELFKLKGEPSGASARAFLSADETGRRHVLTTSVKEVSSTGLVPLVSPRSIDSLEWFASTADLSRLMEWLETETREGAGRPARELLAINPGLPTVAGSFRYIGFKGGSEPGVLNLTFLLEGRDGSLHTLVATWNDTERSLDAPRFYGLVERALRVLGGR